MLPTSLSASAMQGYESCPARYKASYIDKAPDLSGSAANLGSACHEVLELYVKAEAHLNPDKKLMKRLWKETYPKYFSDHKRYDEGEEMLMRWFDRADFSDGRVVLSTEVKETFDLKTSAGIIPFTFIWDRCDRLPDGSIEVIDYKSWSIPVQPETLRKKIQARAYAVAAAIKYPDAPEIWVTMDQLRYDPVGIRFSRDDNVETWHYLRDLAERILADDGTEERLNPECRWCIRKGVCETLNKHVDVGGSLAVANIEEAVNKRARLDYAKAGIESQLRDLDEYILEQAQKDELTDYATDEVRLEITAGSRRSVDSERVGKVMGPEFMAENGTISVKVVDAVLKDKTVPEETRSQLRQLIQRKWNNPSIKTTPIAPLGDDH